MPDDSDTFLREIETLSHAARVRVMIALGKQAQENPAAATTIAVLEQQGFYERYLALYSCYGSRDGAHALRALADPSHLIRGLAIRLIAILGDAAQIQTALMNFPAQRIALLWRLRQQRKEEHIDTFLESTDLAHDRQFYAILPFGSRATVLNHVAHFREFATQQSWSYLSRLHPGIATDLLEAWAQEASDVQAIGDILNALMPRLVKTQSWRLAAIVGHLLPSHASDDLVLNPTAFTSLFHYQAVVLGDMLIARNKPMPSEYGDRRSRSFIHAVATLRDDQIERLLEIDSGIFGSNANWFARLPFHRRRAIFPFVRHALLDQHGILPSTVLELLPTGQCEQEARAIISKTRLGDERLHYAYLLPWDEMLALIADFLHTQVIEKRTMALHAVIFSARFHREHLGDLLEILRERRMEPDLMRRNIFTDLGTVSLSSWQDIHLPDLAEIIQHGLRDVGLSDDTQRAMLRFLIGLLPHYFDWATDQITMLLHQRGFVRSTKPEHYQRSPKAAPPQLTVAYTEKLAEALLPIFLIWQQQEKEKQILDTVEFFLSGRHIPGDVLSLLEIMLHETRSRTIAERVWQCIAKHNMPRLNELLPMLLQEDASLITVENVAAHLLYRRQDLLDPFLRYTTYAGRFTTGRQRYLPVLSRRFAGGTARQQEQFAHLLQEIITDPTADVRTITNSIKQMVYLPALSVDRLDTLAHSENSLVRTTALFALGHLDTRNGVPILIDALQDSRARIAITNLRPFLHRMPQQEALSILKATPMDRVTVSKEVIRLMAELDSREALEELLTREQGDLHKDVRLVLLEGLWRYSDQPEVLAVFSRVAQSPDAEIALTALPPYNMLPEGPWRYSDQPEALAFFSRMARSQDVKNTFIALPPYNRYINGRLVRQVLPNEALRLITLLLHHPSKMVQEQAIAQCGRLTQQDQDGILMPALLTILAERHGSNCLNIADAIFTVCREDDLLAIGDVMRAKLPDREAVNIIVHALLSRDRDDRKIIISLCRLLITQLSQDPMTVKLRIDLAKYLPREELVDFLTSLAEKNELHDHALESACELINYYRFTMDDLAFMEASLAGHADERLRYLAFCMLKKQTSRKKGWSPEYRERLQRYRADPSLLVASAAQFTFPENDQDED
jgi:HEAT repeat protein